MEKDGFPLVTFEAIWGYNDLGRPCLNFNPELFSRRVLIDEIDVTFLDQPDFRDRILEFKHQIGGVTASATAMDAGCIAPGFGCDCGVYHCHCIWRDETNQAQ